MNITIVEDDPTIREKLALFLQEEGYTITLIKDFKEVVESLLKVNTDLILLDINLPYLDGFNICRKIKKSPMSRLFLLQVVILQKTK